MLGGEFCPLLCTRDKPTEAEIEKWRSDGRDMKRGRTQPGIIVPDRALKVREARSLQDVLATQGKLKSGQLNDSLRAHVVDPKKKHISWHIFFTLLLQKFSTWNMGGNFGIWRHYRNVHGGFLQREKPAAPDVFGISKSKFKCLAF